MFRMIDDVHQPIESQPIGFRRLTTDDFPLLRGWLERPYVARWWHHETEPAAIERDFGPAARGEEPAEDLLALLGDRPFGLVQRCRLADYPDYRDEIAAITDVPSEALTIDYLIGEPDLVGRGLGTKMLTAVIRRSWRDHPAAEAIIVPVAAANTASWRVLTAAGLRRVAEGELEPDNPADSRDHYLYRVDRSA